MSVTKGEWRDWLDHPVTKEVIYAINEAVENAAEALMYRFPSDPMRDSYDRGFLKGVQALMNYRPESTDESTDQGS